MGRLLNVSSGDTESPSLSTILEEEILQVDRQLVDMQTTAEELSGLCIFFYFCIIIIIIIKTSLI